MAQAGAAIGKQGLRQVVVPASPDLPCQLGAVEVVGVVGLQPFLLVALRGGEGSAGGVAPVLQPGGEPNAAGHQRDHGQQTHGQ
jgi:hypothetical protein